MGSSLNYARNSANRKASAATHAAREAHLAESRALFPYRRHGMPTRIEFEMESPDGLKLGIVGWDEKRLYAARYSRATKAWTTHMEPWQTLRLLEAWFQPDEVQ